MLDKLRSATLHVCDLDNNPICLIYDSAADIEGSAINIIFSKARNGAKSISFDLPVDESGSNFREQYLIPEYRIRAITENENITETDFYIITKDSIKHSNKSKNISVSVSHTSTLLKYKALDKEYSDKEGNNTGTINAIITDILKGTGWTFDADNSYRFYEKDRVTEKVRSLQASVKTGAFGLINKVCDLFDAKPIFTDDGINRTVKVLPMNPFSIDKDSGMPKQEDLSGKDILELNYGVNLKSTVRNIDSENIATVLYAYGSYGDNVSKYCGIENIKFKKWSGTVPAIVPGYIRFTVTDLYDGTRSRVVKFSCEGCEPRDVIEYYDLDQASSMYVWNATQGFPIKIDSSIVSSTSRTFRSTELERKYSFLMDFSYYSDNGMLTDSQIEAIARYQVGAFEYLENITEATEQYSSDYSKLSETAGINDYVKLSVQNVTSDSDGYVVLNLDIDQYPDDGIIYTTQIDVKKDKRFKWYVSDGLDNYGDPINKGCSCLYFMSTSGKQIKTFIKTINRDSNDNIISLTTHLKFSDYSYDELSNMQYFLFSYDSIGGNLGMAEAAVDGIKRALNKTTTFRGVQHRIYYLTSNQILPLATDVQEWGWTVIFDIINNQYSLKFCGKIFNDSGWNGCTYGYGAPIVYTSNNYYYDASNGIHYRYYNNDWIKIYDPKEAYTELKALKAELVKEFTSVWSAVKGLTMYSVGQYDSYITTVSSFVPGQYYFNDEFNNYIIFSLAEPINEPLIYESTRKQVKPLSGDVDFITPAKMLSDVTHFSLNEIDNTSFSVGKIDNTGNIDHTTGYYRSGVFTLRPSTTYYMKGRHTYNLCFYNEMDQYLYQTRLTVSGSYAEFTTGSEVRKCRIWYQSSVIFNDVFLQRLYAENHIVYDDKDYVKVNVTGDGVRHGVYPMTQNFITYSDTVYLTDLPAIDEAQEHYNQIKSTMVNSLGSIYRESFWQDSSYVEGDEQKLFDDAVENLEKLAQPTISYTIDFIDLYSSDLDDDNVFKWQDIDYTSPVHIIDEDANINTWAFIDKLDKCYDSPQKTRLTINTNLTKMTQQSFTDVLTNIANVAEETKLNSTIYKRAAALSGTGYLTAEKLKGELAAQTVKISGGNSSWETDEQGRIIFNSADGNSSMMLSGAGLMIADTKDNFGRWEYHTAISGNGIVADAITTGEMSAVHLIAGTITTDKINSSVGEQLDISSSESLNLYATVDGSKPSGRVNIEDPDSHQSIITIDSTNGIYVGSTSKVMIDGSDVVINGKDIINLTAGSTLTIDSGTFRLIAGGGTTYMDGGTTSFTNNNIFLSGTSAIRVGSSGSVTVQGGTTGSSAVLDNTGITVTGESIKLLTNSGTNGMIQLGSNQNVLRSDGVLSLADGGIILNGPNNEITTSGTTLNFSADTLNFTGNGSINMNAGTFNATGASNVNITSGGSLTVTSTGALDITSPNFTVNNSGASIKGTVTADAGSIGGWNIGDSKLYSGTQTSYVSLSSVQAADPAIWQPNTTYAVGDKVKYSLTGNTSNYRMYKCTVAHTSSNSDKPNGSNHWEIDGDFVAIYAGSENVNNAPFRVYRDGSLTINKLERYKGQDTTEVELVDLRSSLVT